jgi:hypothetical protein
MIRSDLLRMAAGAGLLLISACERTPAPPATDILETFESASAPATRDEVMAALPPGGLTPTPEVAEAQLANGYLLDQYLIDGETVEVLWVHDPGEGRPTEAFRERLNPLIFRSGLLDGSGWEHFDRRAGEWGIPDRWASAPAGPPSDLRSF